MAKYFIKDGYDWDAGGTGEKKYFDTMIEARKYAISRLKKWYIYGGHQKVYIYQVKKNGMYATIGYVYPGNTRDYIGNPPKYYYTPDRPYRPVRLYMNGKIMPKRK